MCVHIEPWGMPTCQSSKNRTESKLAVGGIRFHFHILGRKFTTQVELLSMASRLWFYTADPHNPAGATSRLHLRPLVISGGLGLGGGRGGCGGSC